MDYKSTLNMPKSGFPMRAGLPKREPEMLKHWEEMDLYNLMLKKNEGKPRFALHDGPPFSNGGLHMGHALNKSLKDFITRSYAMRGYYTPYIPGWDNHGMPIESAIIKQNKLNHKAMPVSEFRSACHEFAQHYIDVQMEGFKRIGVLGDWEHPYKTMDPGFEAEEVKVFGEMYKKGYIYKGLKPVYWCYHDETALAEAEIEYQDDPCTTVYVKFPMNDDLGKLSHLDKSKLNFVIWTTTIWTLPGNLAIALHPDESYAIVKNEDNGEMYIVAEALVEKVMTVGNVEHYSIVETHPGNFYENMLASHPFLPKTSRLVLADYVTMDSGTGCVHTAPGFGADDYQTCRRYGMDMVVPVNDQGRHTDYAGKYEGMLVEESNPVILADMKESGALFASEEIVHSYPHCWRCKHPIIFRATPQWFCSVDSFKDEACAACDDVRWVPGWGIDRMKSMIRERADWCISRQRRWGLPIPVFYCKDCGKPICTDYAGKYEGMLVEESNPVILADMKESGALFASEEIVHSYPHCWRCKHPIIFRATPQWFCSVDSFKDEACAACDDVRWVPGWGIDRMKSMIRERADWCISRQRRWGLPIPVFYCKDCGKPICTDETIKAVSDLFAEKGSNAWFDMDAADILPKGFTCPHCGKNSGFTKEEDTLDGWFDSGSTHFASMKKDQGFWPATMYLEGLDQYRGWFQSSLLTAVGAFGQGAPFKECVTHGWTVDGEGKAMHKSLGNGVDPADVFNENGADILRLWAASADYHADVRCSKEIFKQLSQNYLKFRNTCKFMLDNLVDFDPEKLTKPEDMPVLDRWLLTKLNELIEKAEQSYCDYEFHIITHAVNDFCVNTLSSFYLDIVKDRLYCEGAESATRRSAQTALYLTLHTLSKLFAPILAFTCDEIWLAMPHAGDDDARNVVLNEMNKPFTAYALDSETMARWEHIIAVRTVVNGALEEARAAKVIGKSLEADVHLTVPESDRFFADESPEALADIFIVSKVELAIGDVLAVKVDNAAGTKCPRCWKHSLEANAEGLCPRCAEVVKHLHLTELL